jgi:hypothetical protein
LSKPRKAEKKIKGISIIIDNPKVRIIHFKIFFIKKTLLKILYKPNNPKVRTGNPIARPPKNL